MESNVSPNFSLNKTDLMKIAKGAVFAIGGALLTYIADTIPHIDFGAFTPAIVAINSVLMNAAFKWLTANSYK